ncbi:hypothetical protein [Neorhodopirellula pilleata]|uniref:Uncharacterized protein n=1 Tax=Neorhodopirellula pilleata TaxID=2714738 RepID=A0A5C5ZYR5_9BACT|nr:hypothetical protein [Neorhodopirellula pilleata]TWT91394.1 hypothetical protein Pla100_52440 [Neorhodopirellula pilleata]TWT91443.1 hypothetical protein Pla100_52930 [Neorhodopirellula pilleata]
MKFLENVLMVYLSIGMFTAAAFHLVFGEADGSTLASVLVFWPVYWFMAIVFAAAAAGAPY